MIIYDDHHASNLGKYPFDFFKAAYAFDAVKEKPIAVLSFFHKALRK